MTEPAAYKISKPYITKNLEVNSCHIRKEDNDLLTDRKDDCPVTYYSYDYGFFVFVPDENIGTEIKAAKTFGFSDEFLDLIQKAHSLKCKYLQVDSDGVEYENLSRFE